MDFPCWKVEKLLPGAVILGMMFFRVKLLGVILIGFMLLGAMLLHRAQRTHVEI